MVSCIIQSLCLFGLIRYEKLFFCVTESSVYSVVLIGWLVLKYNDELRSDSLENVYALFRGIDFKLI